MAQEVLHCLEPSCNQRFVRESAYYNHIEKHINGGQYLPDVTAAGRRKAEAIPGYGGVGITISKAKRQIDITRGSPSHVILIDKTAHAKRQRDRPPSQEARRSHGQSLVRPRHHAILAGQSTTNGKYQRQYRNKERAITPDRQVEKRRKRWFKRTASGSIATPSSGKGKGKGKTAVVDLRSPSRSRSASVTTGVHDHALDISQRMILTPDTIDDRPPHLYTPEATPTPLSHQRKEDDPNKTTPNIVDLTTPFKPPCISPPLSGPRTPDSSMGRVGPTWSISPDVAIWSIPIDRPLDEQREEPIGEVFARMLLERDELHTEDEVQAGDAESEVDSQVDSPEVIPESSTDAIDPPLTPPIFQPSMDQARRPSPPSLGEDPPHSLAHEVIDISSDTDEDMESVVDEWDLFDVENQIFGYRVFPCETLEQAHKVTQTSVPKSPFKGLSPRHVRPDIMRATGV